MGQTVFVPVSREQARRLHDAGPPLPQVTGQAATPALLAAHGCDASMLEDAEFAALTYAGVRALTLDHRDALRLVLAAEVPAAAVAVQSDDQGTVQVTTVAWSDVRALFADEPEAADRVAAARAAAAGQLLARAVDLPEVEHLLEEHDLLWYAPQELPQLLEG